MGGTGHEATLSGHAGLQVRVLELEKTLEAERMRLGELRKQHYVLAGAVGTPSEEDPGQPSAAARGGASKKPPLAQKPSVAPRQDHQVPGVNTGAGKGLGPWESWEPLTGRSRNAAPATWGGLWAKGEGRQGGWLKGKMQGTKGR